MSISALVSNSLCVDSIILTVRTYESYVRDTVGIVDPYYDSILVPRDIEGDWGIHEERRERLLARVYAAVEDAARLRAVRRKLFDRSGSASDFEAWQASLAPAEQH